MSQCTNCEAETADGQHLCTPDRVTLYRILARVRETLNTAGSTLTNQAVAPVNTGGAAGSTAPGMPLNLDMLEKAAHYRSLIGDWSGQVAEATHQLSPVDVLNRAAWLAKQTMNIARFEWAGDMLTELQYAERAVVRAADRHAHRILLGTCGRLTMDDHGAVTICQGNIQGHEGDDRATCQTCHAQHSAADRRQGQLQTATHAAAPLPTILRALKTQGHNLKRTTVQYWIQKGTLTPAHIDDTGRHHYTIAAVLEANPKTTTTTQHFG